MSNKILILLTSFDSNSGGIQKISSDIIDAISKSPDTFAHIFSLNDHHHTQIKNNIVIKTFTQNKILFTLNIGGTCLKIRPNIIILGHINFLFLGVLVKVFCRAKLCCWLYGVEAWHVSKINRYLARLVDAFISISIHTMDLFKRNVPNAKVLICPPSVSMECSAVNTANAIELKTPFLLIVGRLDNSEKGKGHRQIIRAMKIIQKEITNISLYIVGKGDDETNLRSLILDLHLESSVFLKGFIQDEVLTTYYEQCDIFVMPSKQEGFGIVYLEAMKHKKPCISGNADAGKEVVINDQTGYAVDPENITELADKIIYLMKNEVIRKQMGAAGYKRWRDLYSDNHIFETIQNVLCK